MILRHSLAVFSFYFVAKEEYMETNVIEIIAETAETIKGCKLKEKKLVLQRQRLQLLQAYFSCTEMQAIFIISVFDLNSQGTSPDLEDIAQYLKCSSIKMLLYDTDFDLLLDRGLLALKSRRSFRHFFTKNQYEIPLEIKEAVMENEPIKVQAEKKSITVFDVLKELSELLQSREDEVFSTNACIRKGIDLIEDHSQFPIFNDIWKLGFTQKEVFIFFIIVWENLESTYQVELGTLSKALFDDRSDRITFEQVIIDEKGKLFTHNFIKIIPADFVQRSELTLTKKAQQYLKERDIKIHTSRQVNKETLLLHKDISKVKMHYNDAEQQQIDFLSGMLMPRKFKQLQKSLEQEKLRKGVAVLLYGVPGTGKTETVFQIAKQTRRDIFKVDVSQLKSKWYGESQKNVKKLFDTYKEISAEQTRTPILLLNEADAILTSRNASDKSSTGRAEHAIQNIFLEALENFEGILFATTNFEQSLDSAFERRFLYKICYNKPTLETRSKIWKSKFPATNKAESLLLAKKYIFSGGQIENILRKYKMQAVLLQRKPNFEELNQLCNEEISFVIKQKRIGFTEL